MDKAAATMKLLTKFSKGGAHHGVSLVVAVKADVDVALGPLDKVQAGKPVESQLVAAPVVHATQPDGGEAFLAGLGGFKFALSQNQWLIGVVKQALPILIGWVIGDRSSIRFLHIAHRFLIGQTGEIRWCLKVSDSIERFGSWPVADRLTVRS